jgi:hypothetical protein
MLLICQTRSAGLLSLEKNMPPNAWEPGLVTGRGILAS